MGESHSNTPDDPTQDDPTLDDPTLDDPTPDDPTPDDPTLDDPTPDDPTPDDPTPDDPTLDDPTPDDPTPDDPTLDDPTPDDPTRSDPLCLTSLVVDGILEHLDDPSLLTGRLVCRSWNIEIIIRNGLWKKRCQQKPVFCFDLSSTPLDDVFHQYVLFHHVYHRMMSGNAFQVDDHSEALDCCHGAREDRSLSQISRSETSEDWKEDFKDLFSNYRQLWVCIDTALVVTSYPALMMVDLRTQEVLWLHSDVRVIFYDHFCPGIYAVTHSGDVQRFSNDGDCELQIDTRGKLIDACFMSVHSSCHFILVGLENDDVHLVDVDSRQVIQLQLSFPEIPEDDKEREGDLEDEDCHLSLGYLSDDSLPVGQLAICICGLYSLLVVIIDTRGNVLHQASKVFRRRLCWNDWMDGSFVLKTRTGVEKYAISCTSSGIQLNLVWQKGFPDRLRSTCAQTCAQVFLCGDQWILCQRGPDLLVFSVDTGRQLVSIPGFFSGHHNSESNLWRLVDVSGDSPEHIARRVQISQASQWDKPFKGRNVHVFSTNTSWLNGLSPATMTPGTPVLYMSESDTEIKCLRWSQDLWSGSGLQLPGPENQDPSPLLPERWRNNSARFLAE